MITPIRPRAIDSSAVQFGGTWRGCLSVAGFVETYCSHKHRSYDAALTCNRKRKERLSREIVDQVAR